MISRPVEPLLKTIIMSALLLALTLCLSAKVAIAGSATWNLNPTSGDWNTAANWTPSTVPDGPNDIATFSVSNVTTINIRNAIEVNGITFDAGASGFVINLGYSGENLTVSGAGITNNSGHVQGFGVASQTALLFTNSATAGQLTDFNSLSDGTTIQFFDSSSAANGTFGSESGGSIEFFDSATAADGTFTNSGVATASSVVFYANSTAANGTFTNLGSIIESGSGLIQFLGNSTANHGTFANEGGSTQHGMGGFIEFYDEASAGNAFFTNKGGITDADGGRISFFGSSSAAGGTFVNEPSDSSNGATGAVTQFSDTSTAGSSILIANGETAPRSRNLIHGGGLIEFLDNSDGDAARVEVFGNGILDVSGHNSPEVKIGSLEGDGIVFLGSANLTVGTNNLSTTFSGLMQDGDNGAGGSLTKAGIGNLILSSLNTYTGGTIVESGILLVNNVSGSGTGRGRVQVRAGTLGGVGTISGTVIVGTGSGPGAILGPGARGVTPGTLNIKKTLTLMADATYRVTIDSSVPVIDKVIARGVRVRGAQILLNDLASTHLSSGTVFTVINNAAATRISGTFANLPDGGTVVVGSNTFQANYEGGDGNDLTLTVIQ